MLKIFKICEVFAQKLLKSDPFEQFWYFPEWLNESIHVSELFDNKYDYFGSKDTERAVLDFYNIINDLIRKYIPEKNQW